MLTVQIKGLQNLRQQLTEFSDRRFESAVAEAINKTGRSMVDAWNGEIFTRLDRPTPFSYRAGLIKERADVGRLAATVALQSDTSKAYITPAEYLLSQERGATDRRLKRFEQALVRSGAMPQGHKAVPGQYAQLDNFGNVSRSQIISVLNQLGGNLTKGYAQVTGRTGEKRAKVAAQHGRKYVALPAGKGRSAGVYEVGRDGLMPIFFFVRATRYERRINLEALAGKVWNQEHEKHMAAAVQKRIESLAKRGNRG